MTGFAAAQRSLIDHHLFEGDASRLGAWVWLFLRAAWKPTPFDISGKTITIERGQLCVSRAQLAKAWGWSPSAVERFLTRLQTEQMIERATGQGRSIITICNYDKYQSIEDKPGQATGQATGQRSDSDRTAKEQGNKETIEEPNGSSPPVSPPSKKRAEKRATKLPEGWQPVLTERAQQIVDGWPPGQFENQLRQFRDHAADKGRVSKDWQAAFRNWIDKANEWMKRDVRSGAGKSSGGSRVDRRDSYSRVIQERAGIGTFAFDAETPE